MADKALTGLQSAEVACQTKEPPAKTKSRVGQRLDLQQMQENVDRLYACRFIAVDTTETNQQRAVMMSDLTAYDTAQLHAFVHQSAKLP